MKIGAALAGPYVQVTVDTTNGEYLHYSVVPTGGTSVFRFECQDREKLKQSNVANPGPSQWDWFRNAGDSDSNDDYYYLFCEFVGVTSYQATVDHRDRTGAVIKQLQNLTLTPGTNNSLAVIWLHVKTV